MTWPRITALCHDQRPSRFLREALALDLPGADVALDRRGDDVEVHVAAARRGGRVERRGDVAMVAVHVLDREVGVEAEGEQPAADDHRDLVPGAVRQFMRGDGADHADHQSGQQHASRRGPGASTLHARRRRRSPLQPDTHAPKPSGSPGADAPHRGEDDQREQRQARARAARSGSADGETSVSRCRRR